MGSRAMTGEKWRSRLGLLLHGAACAWSQPDSVPYWHPDFCHHSLVQKVDLSHYAQGDPSGNGSSSHLATCGPFVGAVRARLEQAAQSERTTLLASLYHASQLPLVLRSAAKHRVHPYFLGWAEHVHGKGLGDLIKTRLGHWGIRQRMENLDDFRVEKSKCDMLNFFARNRLPTPRVLGQYSTPHEAVGALGSLRGCDGCSDAAAAAAAGSSPNVSSWPIFVKACHLTQGEARSVRKISTADELSAKAGMLPALGCWLRHTYATRADDRSRPWTRESNELTDVVAPGFVLQSAVPSWSNPETGKPLVLELKVEVFYGRAYLAIENRFWTLFVRGGGGGEAAAPACLSQHGHLSSGRYTAGGLWWLIKDSLECAWALAEQTARAMGADGVRIDIFLVPDSSGCVLNELSLSSAMRYDKHEPFIASLWTLPEARRYAQRNAMSEPAASTPVYLLDGGSQGGL